ncbi:potassium channel family protein [Desulfopila sp. IMCC35008]|uniref:potassium channel family protein n=1 Tax=Desulfopila sp. IMCC35008 TaxID=2653858 RepID=UPI0013D4FF75|nr:potassium channel family protein [Desulfopila sp. IMCC35008]
MLFNVAIAIVMIVITTVVHSAGMMLSIRLIKLKPGMLRDQLLHRRAFGVAAIVIIMFCFSLLEVLLWAIPYLAFGAVKGFEEAVYFSMVTYTTLGYGDIVLAEQWRLLTSFEAANGIIMFGWTTAIVMAVIKKAYFDTLYTDLGENNSQ